MANLWSNAVMTTKGLALQAKLIAGSTLTITKVMSGSGSVDVDKLAAQTAVSSPQQSLSCLRISYPSAGKAKLPVLLSNEGVTTAYTAKQVGVYAQDPDEGEILFFIMQADQAATVPGVEIPKSADTPGFSVQWDIYFQYGQADGVTVTVDPSSAQTIVADYVDSEIKIATTAEIDAVLV